MLYFLLYLFVIILAGFICQKLLCCTPALQRHHGNEVAGIRRSYEDLAISWSSPWYCHWNAYFESLQSWPKVLGRYHFPLPLINVEISAAHSTYSPCQTVLPTQANSSQLRWSRVSFGHPLGLSWLEFDQAQTFAQLEPGFPPCGHLSQQKSTLANLFCYCYVTTRPYSGNCMVSCDLTRLGGIVSPPGHASFDFVTCLEFAWVGSTVRPGVNGKRLIPTLIQGARGHHSYRQCYIEVKRQLVNLCPVAIVPTTFDHDCSYRHMEAQETETPKWSSARSHSVGHTDRNGARRFPNWISREMLDRGRVPQSPITG